MLYGDEHVRRYRETDGEEGHDWNGTQALILTTTGRKSGQARDKALIYGLTGDSPVIVASKGGAPAHPDWYVNLVEQPEVEVQVSADRFAVRARIATMEEKPALWRQMAAIFPQYNRYQVKAGRDIPVVILDRL